MDNDMLDMLDHYGGDPMKVLIADDDPPTRILLRAAISQWGYSVMEATDGEEAWKTLQSSAGPQLVILDWIMPKLDGLDVCRKINAELSYRPYIILLTQVSGAENIVKGLEGGADEFLSKPFNMAELRSRLSVGARIIHYKNELKEKYKQLQGYVSNLELVSTLIADVSNKIDELNKVMLTIHETEISKLSVSRMADIRNSMTQLTEVIHQFKAESSHVNGSHS